MSNSISAHVGRTFEITLYGHAGTGYSWCLATITGPVALIEVSTTAVPPVLPGGAQRTTFTFIGTGTGPASADFALLRPWEPQEPADTRSYAISVEADVQANLERAAGNESFPPLVVAQCDGEHEGKVLMDSRANCTLKYGIPATDNANGPCVLKYGFPVTPLYNVHPPFNAGSGPIIAAYMAQPPRQ